MGYLAQLQKMMMRAIIEYPNCVWRWRMNSATEQIIASSIKWASLPFVSTPNERGNSILGAAIIVDNSLSDCYVELSNNIGSTRYEVYLQHA